MSQPSRRAFLAEVGKGMIAASVGLTAAAELGLAPACADEEPGRLKFGALEPLVDLMIETPADRLLPLLTERLRGGATLRELVSAGALANARTFGGEDYVGFHTMMALAPAYRMSLELPPDRSPLPVLKVLYRNTSRLQEYGGKSKEILKCVAAADLPGSQAPGPALRDAVRAKDLDLAERLFARVAQGKPLDAFDALLHVVEDATEVHRVALPHRAWDLLDIIGAEHAHTLLRQSVRYCAKSEKSPWNEHYVPVRPLLAKILEEYKLLEREPGTRTMDAAWVDSLARTIFSASPEQAARAAAAALSEGGPPASVGEALSLAANQLVLRDRGRTGKDVQPNKPEGSVHGDSIGVHASDSANAWRGMARVAGARNKVACLILGAYQVAWDRTERGGDFLHWEPRPLAAEKKTATLVSASELLAATERAIRDNDQTTACALVAQSGELGLPSRPIFDLLLRYATSEDGALHAEKYYRTVSEDFAASSPELRWRHLVGLARVTASEYGKPAPGHQQACELLGLKFS